MPRSASDGLAGVQMAAGVLGESASLFESKQTAARTQADQAERIAELERLVGQLTMENALLKKGSSWLEAVRRRNGP